MSGERWTAAGGQLMLDQEDPVQVATKTIDPTLDEEALAIARQSASSSPEYYAHERAMRRYDVPLRKDGSFRIEDVRPGKYMLRFTIYNNPVDPRLPLGEVGTAASQITVTARPAGSPDSAMNVGVMQLIRLKRLNVGDPAPPIHAKTTDGQLWRLEDYKGKYVLLHFWGAADECTPYLKKCYDAFHTDGKVVIVGLSVGNDLESLRKYATGNPVPWVQATLGHWTETDVPESYGVRNLPTVVLLDPNGRVVARNLTADGIMRAVSNALTSGSENTTRPIRPGN